MPQTTPNFIGRYYHTLGPKGRVSLPKDYRSHFDTAMGTLTIGLDGSLFLFDETHWQTIIDSMSQAPFTKKSHRDWIRLLANNAASVSPDKQGRILIPNYLIQYAQLSKNVVIAGSFNRIEIWDQTKYHQYMDSLTINAPEIAESQTQL